MNFKNYIRYLKYKYELKQVRKDNPMETDRDVAEYFFGKDVTRIKNKYKDIENNQLAYIKNARKINRVAATTLVTLGVVGFLIAGNKSQPIKDNDSSVDTTTISQVTTSEPAKTTNPQENIEDINEEKYDTILTEDQVLDLAEKSLIKIRENLVANGATPMVEGSNQFYPDWFNAKMITSIAFMESSFRTSNKDGSPLLGYGESQRARGMCQLLPSTVDQINLWLKNTMDSDLSYTYEDCDNPNKAIEMCILLCIMNTKNYFRYGKDIYKDLDFKDNPNLQEKCVVASYKYGPGNVLKAYKNGELLDKYLNANWIDGDGANYVKKYSEVYNSIENNHSMQ